MRDSMWRVGMLLAIAGACTKPEVTGTGMMLNMQPSPPQFSGMYDFDLLDPVRGKACARRQGGFPTTVYWTNAFGLEKFSGDDLTKQAIAAATYDAVSNLEGADTIVVTRVLAEGRGPDEVCAHVYGRGVKLKKASPPEPAAPVRAPTPPPAADPTEEPHRVETPDNLQPPF